MVDFSVHCVIGVLIRLSFILYGEFHDHISVVQYTDTDYRVFTDAARHMLSGHSPYERHTYRYTPLIAALLIPNILIHFIWGKVIFSLLDVGIGLVIRKLILLHGTHESVAVRCAIFWIYNPFSIIIATRGNADSLSSILVLLTLLLIQGKYNIILVGVVLGLAIHVRLYPLAFSLPMYLSLGFQEDEKIVRIDRFKRKQKRTYFNHMKKLISLIYPNDKQIKLVISCVIMLTLLTSLCYSLYGYQYLYESILYHLSRQDTRHNFSVYFYMLYLGSTNPMEPWQKALVFAPQAVLLIVLSIIYGRRTHLSFCFLTQAIVMVTYNPVVTSQYFIWFLSLLPPCIPFLNLTNMQAILLSGIWFIAQAAWLFPAYLLEFHGRDTFIFIWILGVVFFIVNIGILAKLIRVYEPFSQSKFKKTK